MPWPSPTRNKLIQSMINLTVCFKTIDTSTSCRCEIMINGNSKACEWEVTVKITNVLPKIFCIVVSLTGKQAAELNRYLWNIYILTFPFLQQKAGPSPGNIFAWQNWQFFAFFRTWCFFGRSLYPASYGSEPLYPISASTAYWYWKSAGLQWNKGLFIN